MPPPLDRHRNGEGRVLPREASEVRTDGVLHGGDGGFTAGLVIAGARGYRRRLGALRSGLEFYVRQVLWFQRAFESIRLQELSHRYSSRLCYQISHHYLYDSITTPLSIRFLLISFNFLCSYLYRIISLFVSYTNQRVSIINFFLRKFGLNYGIMHIRLFNLTCIDNIFLLGSCLGSRKKKKKLSVFFLVCISN